MNKKHRSPRFSDEDWTYELKTDAEENHEIERENLFYARYVERCKNKPRLTKEELIKDFVKYRLKGRVKSARVEPLDFLYQEDKEMAIAYIDEYLENEREV